jgi:hypothetical protein
MENDAYPKNEKGLNDDTNETNLVEPAVGSEPNSAVNEIEPKNEISQSQAFNTELSPAPPRSEKKSKFKLPKIPLNKTTVLAGSLALILIIVGITAFVMTRADEVVETDSVVIVEEEPTELGAAIIIDEGTLEIKSEETGEWQDADTTTNISAGAELRTVGATSRAVIAFDDGSAIRLDANSEIILEEISTKRIEIKQISGYTYNRVLPSEQITYVVTSTDAQYEAQGTAFKTATTGDEQSVEVYHSSVIETGMNKTAKEGEKLTVINKSKPTENGNITKLDIEAVKTDPFMQWNRELDEKDENFKDSLGFLKDVDAPELTINKSDGEVVLLEPNATEGTIEITGKTEVGATLKVTPKSQSGASAVDVTVGSDGNFTTPVLTSPIGDSIFEFVAKDRTGNTTTKTLRITFQKKSQPVAGNAVSFVLSATANDSDSKVLVNWTLKNINAPDGVKVVFSQSSDPVFGGSGVESIYIDKASITSTTIKYSKFTPSGKYYIKACVYDKVSGTCGQYSTQATVDIP